MLKPCIWRRDASANVPSVVQKGPHFCGFSSETTHHVDQCPTPPGMHFFPGVKGVGWGRDAARRLGPGTHTHSPTPIFPTCSWAPLSAWSRWDGVAGGRMLCHQPTFSICFKAAHREDSNAEKQEQCLTNPIGAQTGFTFFFSRVNTNIIAFSSLQVLTGSCHIVAILSGPTLPWRGKRGLGLLQAPSARLGSHQGEQPIFSLFLFEKYLIIIP